MRRTGNLMSCGNVSHSPGCWWQDTEIREPRGLIWRSVCGTSLEIWGTINNTPPSPSLSSLPLPLHELHSFLLLSRPSLHLLTWCEHLLVSYLYYVNLSGKSFKTCVQTFTQDVNISDPWGSWFILFWPNRRKSKSKTQVGGLKRCWDLVTSDLRHFPGFTVKGIYINLAPTGAKLM